jgi:hypothetical protein
MILLFFYSFMFSHKIINKTAHILRNIVQILS